MSNPYDLLNQDDDTFSVGDGESSDIDFFKFQSLAPEVKVVLNDSNFSDSKFKASVSLLACSSKYGFMVAGTLGGFIIGKTADIRTQMLGAKEGSQVPFKDYTEVSVDQGSVNIVALTSDQLQLLVGVSGGMLLVYNIHDIIVKEKMKPVLSHRFPKDIQDIAPNPGANPDLVAVCLNNNDCHFFDIREQVTINTITSITAVSWSFKGKQIACGFSSGRISTFDMNGKPTDRIDIPEEMKANKVQETANRYVSGLLWVDNNTFFAIYSRPRSSKEPCHTPFIIDRKAKPQASYLQLEQVFEFTSSDNRANSHFYLQLVRKLGSNISFLITIANANATALNLVGKETDGAWSTWLIEGGGIPKLPTSSSFDDTFPIGLAVDYSGLESFTPEDSSETVSPMPILFFLTNEGELCAYHYYNSKMVENGEKCDSVVTATDIKLIPEPDMTKTAAKQEDLADKSSKPSDKDLKKPNPEPINTRASKVPVMKTTIKPDENTKGDASTSPTTSAPSGIPRLKHASIGWGSLSNTVTSPSVPAKSNVTPLHDISTGTAKKPDTSLADKTKASPSKAFGQSSDVDLSSKTPFGSTSFTSKPKPEETEVKQDLKPSGSSNTDHSDSHSSSGSEDFVKISTDLSNSGTEETNKADDSTKPQSNLDRNTDQNESQDVNLTQPAPNQQHNKKENISQKQQQQQQQQQQQGNEKRESQKEPVNTVSTEHNVDKHLPVEATQVTEEEPAAISPENDSKEQELEQKEEDTKEAPIESERSDKEEPANVSDNSDEKSPTSDESKANVEKEDLAPKNDDLNKIDETTTKEGETNKQDSVPKEEQVKEQEPVLKNDKQEEAEPSINQDSVPDTTLEVEDKKEAPVESSGAPVQEPEESVIQQVPSEETDKSRDEDDSQEEEFEKIEKPETPEPVEEEASQAPEVTSNSEEEKSEFAPSSDTQIDIQVGNSGVNETEKEETESMVPEISTGSTTNVSKIPSEEDATTSVKDNTEPKVPVDHQKPDQKENKEPTDEQNTDENKPNVIESADENKVQTGAGDEIADKGASNEFDDETTCTADELSTDEEGTEEHENPLKEEEEEEEEEVKPPKPKPEIFFSTYQKKSLQPAQNYQNTGTHRLAISMETQYFETLRVMEQLKFDRQELHHETNFLRKSETKDMSTFDGESTWRMGNINDLSIILRDLESQLAEAEQYESQVANLHEKLTVDDKVIEVFKKMVHFIREFESAKTTDESSKNKDDTAKTTGKPSKTKKQVSAKSKKLPDRKKLLSELVAMCKELVDESHKVLTLDDKLFEDVQAKLDTQKPTVTKTSLRNPSFFSMKHAIRKIHVKLINYLGELDSYEAKERSINSTIFPGLNKAASEKPFVVECFQADRCLGDLFSLSSNHGPRSVKKIDFI